MSQNVSRKEYLDTYLKRIPRIFGFALFFCDSISRILVYGETEICTVGLYCYAFWNFCTYVPYASDGSLDSPDQYEHFDTSLAPSNHMVEALEGVQVLAI
jgi:hypothetical protein